MILNTIHHFSPTEFMNNILDIKDMRKIIFAKSGLFLEMMTNYNIKMLLNSKLFSKQIDKMPIFQELIQKYQQNLPFKDLAIIIAHVLVPNTIPLIASIIVGGGKVLVTNSSVTNNKDTIALLQSVGVEVKLDYQKASDYDYAVDVGAMFEKNPPKYGVVEVTRSGYHKYVNNVMKIPIINVDDSKIKLIETFFGNPEAVLRGINEFLGEPITFLKNKTLAVIGFGKIGRGIARLFKKYCKIIVCDINPEVLKKAKSLEFETVLITNNQTLNTNAILNSDIIITCTGFPETITKYFKKEDLIRKILVNLGAVDEFGTDYSSNDVFMSKDRPFNFNLDPPTENKYIDVILSGQVEGLRYLVSNDLSKKIHPLPEEIDDDLLKKFVEYQNEDINDIYTYFDLKN